ncbi:PAS domain S-box protein, partial [uncultured Phenylobacterium sp.]|uniref:PAS domain S-box protein n=1 Tax=uncultured Phenylobacterium sp. TaxID=349273 RepID=UPI0025F321B4
MHSGTDQAVRRIAEQAGDVIVSVDLGGVISYASPALRTFGYAPDDVVGRTGLDLVHPDDRPRFIENTQALLRGELVDGANRQHRFRCADGRWAWIEGAPQLLHDAAGELVGFVNVLRDITARREQSDLFEVAFEKAAIGKALVGLDGRLLRVNQAFARMVGYAASELLELDFQSLTFPADLDADLERLRSLRAGDTDSYTLDKRYVRRDGACVWGRLSVSMVREPDGSPKHYIAQIQDLTDQ